MYRYCTNHVDIIEYVIVVPHVQNETPTAKFANFNELYNVYELNLFQVLFRKF